MTRPVRILQVASYMTPAHGGAEVWLMELLRHIDRSRFQMDFLVHTTEPQPFHEEIRSLGGKVLPCVRPLYLWRYPWEFGAILRRHGPYDIVHAHILFAGFALRLARLFGVPNRIVHVHADQGSMSGHGPLIDMFLRCTRNWPLRDATAGIAVSRKVAAFTFGENWQDDGRWSVIPCGINLNPFRSPINSKEVRAELGIPPGAFVVAHVGRMVREKNHTFLFAVAKEISSVEPAFRLLLVGDGPLRAQLEAEVKELGLGGSVVWAGLRRDVPRILRGCADVFAFPSLSEGLGLSLVEAQAGGLPCVISDTIPTEVDIIPALVTRLSLQDPRQWATTILKACACTPAITCDAALKEVEASLFNLSVGVKAIEQEYARARHGHNGYRR